jgi:hypothetical protein
VTAVRVTPAQARQLGLPGVPKTTPRKKGKRDRSTLPARDCAPNVCHTCGELLTRPVDEDRHLAAHPTHARYESSLTYRSAS